MIDCNEHNNNEALMLDYLLGNLAPQVAGDFEDQLEENPSLQEELAFEANLFVALNEYVEENNLPEQPPKSTSKIKKMILTVSTIAAIFFAVFVGYKEKISPSPTSSYSYVENNNVISGIQSYLQITDFGYDQVIQSFSSNFIKPSWFELRNGVSG